MGSGKRAKAPCGHLGETVIGTYVQCLRCDRAAVPIRVKPEKTEPMRSPGCPYCHSLDVEEFEDDVDAAIWYMQSRHIPTSTPMPPYKGDWACHTCGKVFTRPT